MPKSLAPLLRHGARRNLPTRAGFSRGNRGAAPSRRDVLRVGGAGLAAAILAPLGGCSSNGRGPQSAGTVNRQRTVIVIGAGFAGLACADTLAHGGMNVVLLEATGRAGGRVMTDRKFIPGDAVELGGEWIGTNHPTWLAFAQEFNLRLEEPGAAPEPEGAGPAGTEPAAPQPGATEPGAPDAAPPAPGEGNAPQPANGPATGAPRPVPFETEMDLGPANGRGRTGEPQAAAKRVIAAAVFQPADPAPGADPAEPRPAPESAPAPEAAPANAAPPEAPATQPGEAEEPIILGGKLYRGAEADKLYEEVDAVLAKLIDLARNIDPVRPWTSPNAADLDARSFAQFVSEQQGLSEPARTLLLTGAEADNGVAADRMSLLGYLAMVAGGGLQDYYELSETYRLADGNDALATALAQKLGDRIRFNAYVDAVRRTPQGVIVRTRGGDYYRGDALVLAAPPSTWSRFQIEPPLHEALRPQMGENVKLILGLREPVWEKEGLTPEVTTDGIVGLTWAATESTTGRGPVALTLFSGAAQAETLRRLPPAERRLQAVASIAPAYPGLAEAVVSERFIDWPGFPLTRASYSFPAPGQVTAFGPTLVDGIVEEGLPPLMFAGEHTAYGFIGYMEGALSSGVRVARALLAGPSPTPVEPPAQSQPAETQPTETQPVDAQPAPESVPESAPEAAPEAQPAPEPEPVPEAEPAGVPG